MLSYDNFSFMMSKARFKILKEFLEKEKIFFSDLLRDKDKRKDFLAYFDEQIKPFEILNSEDGYYSVNLHYYDYHYDWKNEIVTNDNAEYGDGHDYNDLFYEYLDKHFKSLNNSLKYDSEMSMFCVYCHNKEDAENVAYELSKLYKDEKKMLDLIKELKEKRDYIFIDF